MNGKAAIFTQPGKPMEVREFPLPTLEAGAILVRVTMANICGSDLHMWRGEATIGSLGGGGGGPWVLGHEMTGRVHALGAGVKTDSLGEPLKEGDRVVYTYYKPCGRCYVCIKGELAACPHKFPSWWLAASQPPHFTGAYAEYYYLMPGQHIFKVPPELPDEVVAPVNCALAQVTYGLDQVGVQMGDTVVIQGAGGLGINAIAVAREMGAGQVIVIDRFPERLNLATRFGADQVIDMSQITNPRERTGRVRELTSGRGADVVVEVTGAPQAVTEGIPMLRVGGRYLWIGNINRGLRIEIDPSHIVLGNRKVVGTGTYAPWAIPRALDLLKRTQKKYPFRDLISHKYPLAEINRAFQEADTGKVTRAAILP